MGTGKQMLITVESPLVKLSKTTRRLGNRQAIEGFIVNDDEDNDEDIPLLLNRRPKEMQGAFLMSWQHIFESVFLGVVDEGEHEKSTDILRNVLNSIQNGLEEDHLTMKTLFESTSFFKLSENLEDVRTALDRFFDSLPQDSESLSTLVISNTAASPGVELPLDGDLKPADLMKIYQDLVDKWIASLPLEASNAVRGSKFRTIRQITAELFFSSVTISLQSKSSMVPTVVPERDDEAVGEGEDAGMSTRESSPATFFSAQMSFGPPHDPGSTLRTPTQTPSTYSRLTSAAGPEEDSAISRLRQYAVSINPRPDVRKSKILSEWPIVPGVDPASYVYKPKTSFDDEDSAPESSKKRRDVARRKKRTEKFLQKNAESSRRVVTPSGSQPAEVQPPAFSSQPMEDVPMTQPDRGNFGSRKAKGKKKQRTAGF